MSPAKKKATSTRHEKAKRAAKRSRGRRKSKAARRAARQAKEMLAAGGTGNRARSGRPERAAGRRASAAARGGPERTPGREARRDVRGGPERTPGRGAGAAARRGTERVTGREARRDVGGRPERTPGRGARGRSSGAMKQDAPPPKLAVVARPAARKPGRQAKPGGAAQVSEFAGARAGASPKDLALFELERARVAVHAAIQGLGAGAANRPVAEDKWSVRQIVLHLAFWDREIVQKYLEAAAARNQRAGIRHAEIEAMNATGLAPLEHHDWESAKRLLQSTREDLWDALDSIPAEPAEVWSREHAVGELVWEVTKHDRHHADVIKRWRAESGT